jgi:hypothetical protein
VGFLPVPATRITAASRGRPRSSRDRLRRVHGGLFAIGMALVAGGGLADLTLHLITGVVGLADPLLTQAESAGHIVILAGMAIAIGGVIGQAVWRSRAGPHRH